MIKSIYIHIPFCKRICTYCDFCKLFYNTDYVDQYLCSLEKEISLNYAGEFISTLYVGGGTPSCLNYDQLSKLFSIIDKIKLNKTYEFTFECNIEDIEEDLLVLLKNNGVNRLSIGVQSFNKKLLDILGRTYDFDINDKINLCKKYFSNINLDFIYGIKNETLNDLRIDLEKFINLDINHISIYCLILEDNTVLKINNYDEIGDDLCREMYDYICTYLKNHGYDHYEISNFAKNESFSKHNLTYWNNDKYYGFGLGASGYVNNYRYTNTRSITKYLKGEYISEKDLISPETDMENFMILGLRKIEGVSNTEFKDRYNKNIGDVFNVKNLCFSNGYYYINEDNLYVSNYILRDFIDIKTTD